MILFVSHSSEREREREREKERERVLFKGEMDQN